MKINGVSENNPDVRCSPERNDHVDMLPDIPGKL